MDELRAFMNNPFPSRAQVIKLRGPLTGGFRITKDDPSLELDRRQEHRHSAFVSGKDYVKEAKQKESDLYLKNEVYQHESDSMCSGLESLEQLTNWQSSQQNMEQLTDEAMTEVYNKYSFQMKEDTNNLPINLHKKEILRTIETFPVVIIEGPTGCGKTTQVPQWILDDCYQKRRPCKIIVTQPRRIAAISIAKRVAQERGWDVGGLVGYQVSLENKGSADTRIHYVTTGILLQKLVSAKTLNEYTHIILDEVHERGQDMDFLLIVVKKLLTTVSPRVKIILMSATFNSDAFSSYFKAYTPDGLQKSYCVNVGRKNPMFTVKTFYLNHLTKFGAFVRDIVPKDGEPISQELQHLVIKLVNAFEYIDEQEDNITDSSQADLPSVLIFLPGINEIEELYMCLTDLQLRAKLVDETCARHKWWVLPLHSSITADEQVRVFQRAPRGHRKIILSTNIAESSITVPDVKYVIDFCLMKVLIADEETNFTTLRTCWAAKSNCDQRAGRAGRVRDGRVYRLVSDTFYEDLKDECDPEIVRCPLEQLVLLAKMLDMGTPSQVLALAMDPPDLTNIHRTILVLKEIGALTKTMEDEWCALDGDITYLGRIMAKLPLNVQASKLIVLGYIYGCLDEAVIMASSMSIKSIFNTPFRERLNAYNSKLTWADGSTSDSIAALNVYKVWSHLRQQQQFRSAGSEAQWARRFYVQARALRELDALVRDVRARIARAGLDHKAPASPWAKHELPLALKIILAGAFYPQYFVQASQDEARERDAVRTLSGLDPRHSVYLSNFPDNQPGEIYATSIKRAIRQQIGDEPRVTFDNNSRKAYLTFDVGSHLTRKDRDNSGDPTIPGQVALPVYKSIKARQLRLEVRIPLLPHDKAQALAAAMKMENLNLDVEKMVPRLPDINDTHVPLKICHMIEVGKFWVQYDDESTATELRDITTALNTRGLLAHADTLTLGQLYAAPYVDSNGTVLHRVRLLKMLPHDMIDVVYIDWGTLGRVNACNVRSLPGGVCSVVPPLAMRCRLAALAPAPLLHTRDKYSSAAHNYFRDVTAKGRLIAKVYSVVHGVISIELLAEGGKLNVNQELIKRGYAVACEESYESKLNHDLRETAHSLDLAQIRAYNKQQTELAYDQLRELDPPNTKECVANVCLKGPFSPLETTSHPLMYASREKQVHIEWTSVNSVLLDTDPQLTYERLLVAAEVSQNESSSKLSLRHTTLLPNIPALPAIIALIFCPNAELRRSASCSRYASALCGLGSAADGAPHFPEHDLLVNVDADLHVDDIGLINQVRHLTDYMMYCADGEALSADNEFKPQIPAIIRKNLMQLVSKRRKQRGVESIPRAWEWCSVPEDELLEMCAPTLHPAAPVYPLHVPIDLHPVSKDHLLQLKRQNDLLKMQVNRASVSSNVEMTCTLCNTAPMPTHAMRIHLYSNAHQEKEEDFKIFQS